MKPPSKPKQDYRPYLAERCYHGVYDPHRCLTCVRAAIYRAEQAEATHHAETSAEIHAQRVAEREAEEDLERFNVFLDHLYPDVDRITQSLTFARDKQAQAEWNSRSHEITIQLF